MAQEAGLLMSVSFWCPYCRRQFLAETATAASNPKQRPAFRTKDEAVNCPKCGRLVKACERYN